MSDVPRLTREQAAIIGAFTGIAAGPFSDIHGYAERVLGHPIWTHQFADSELMEALKEAARDDFIAITAQDDEPAARVQLPDSTDTSTAKPTDGQP